MLQIPKYQSSIDGTKIKFWEIFRFEPEKNPLMNAFKAVGKVAEGCCCVCRNASGSKNNSLTPYASSFALSICFVFTNRTSTQLFGLNSFLLFFF